MAKLPAFQFYPGDWRKDPALARCTFEEKGFYIDLLCLMFECEERGVLVSSDVAWSDCEIALAVGGDQHVALSCLHELARKGVIHRDSRGAVFSRRMVRDEELRRKRSAAGSKGGKKATGLAAKNKEVAQLFVEKRKRNESS